jgi:hypothetical protein
MTTTVELTKDKFGQTITVTDIEGTHSFAERNAYERHDFYKLMEYLDGETYKEYHDTDVLEIVF